MGVVGDELQKFKRLVNKEYDLVMLIQSDWVKPLFRVILIMVAYVSIGARSCAADEWQQCSMVRT